MVWVGLKRQSFSVAWTMPDCLRRFFPALRQRQQWLSSGIAACAEAGSSRRPNYRLTVIVCISIHVVVAPATERRQKQWTSTNKLTFHRKQISQQGIVAAYSRETVVTPAHYSNPSSSRAPCVDIPSSGRFRSSSDYCTANAKSRINVLRSPWKYKVSCI